MSAYWGGHLSWILALALVGLVKAIIWNRSYKTYVIKGKHRNSKDITKVVYSTSEENAVQIFRDFHNGSEIHSVKDCDQNGWNGKY
jgi:cytoskeletal protein RodZ